MGKKWGLPYLSFTHIVHSISVKCSINDRIIVDSRIKDPGLHPRDFQKNIINAYIKKSDLY